jgi:phenylpropionate dioxygenase-like ring-hydroxylating dioxygenase large terminal subunit
LKSPITRAKDSRPPGELVRRRSFVPVPKGPPPDFATATNLRQRARAAGMDPNHWYAVAQSSELDRGERLPTRFWGRDVVVWRGTDGTLGAAEDRCAHRQLKLSPGVVEGCNLVCPYHGWAYAPDGKVVRMPHETFGHKALKFRVEAFAVREKYGLVWVFFGDPEKAGPSRCRSSPSSTAPTRGRASPSPTRGPPTTPW